MNAELYVFGGVINRVPPYGVEKFSLCWMWSGADGDGE